MRLVFVLLALVFGLSRVLAQDAKPPTVKVEDTWTYLVTSEGKKAPTQSHMEMDVTKADGPVVVMSVQEVGSKKRPTEQTIAGDWTQSKTIGGHEVVVNKPFEFPMAPKKTWAIDYVEPGQGHPHGREHIHAVYTAVGWEPVTVPAGDFKAMKIECEAVWVPDTAPRTGTRDKRSVTQAKPIAAGPEDAAEAKKAAEKAEKVAEKPHEKITRIYWYVPAVKRWVKSVEEHYAANGTRTDRVTEELEGYLTSE